MSSTHWKTMMDNKYIGVCDFGLGEYKNLKIKAVRKEQIPPKNENRPVIYFEGSNKPFVCNATNGNTISKLLGSSYIEKWVGHTITLFADMSVRSPGQKRTDTPDGGVRVFNQLPKVAAPKKIKCSNCGEEITDTEIQGTMYSANKISKLSGGLCYKCYVEKAKAEKTE